MAFDILDDNLIGQIIKNSIINSNLSYTFAAIDDDQPLIYVNQTFLDETGYSFNEVIGKNCRFLQGKNTDRKTVNQIKQALKRFEPIDIEILNYRKNGSVFLNRLRISTVFDQNRKPMAYMGVQSNENEIIKNVRMTQEERRLESLGHLSANISHEIKNTLQPIRLMLDHIKDIEDTIPQEARKCISIANINMNIAEGLVKDILRFSKKKLSNKERMLTNELVHDAERFAKNLIPQDVSIKTHIDVNITENKNKIIHAHRNSIYQILTNLINNALDATNKKGEIQFSASTSYMLDNQQYGLEKGKYLLLMVEDNGKGITENIVDSVFDPFFSTKSPSDGTGLGLAISIQLAREHGGTIVAENIPHSGARFTLFLPYRVNHL